MEFFRPSFTSHAVLVRDSSTVYSYGLRPQGRTDRPSTETEQVTEEERIGEDRGMTEKRR